MGEKRVNTGLRLGRLEKKFGFAIFVGDSVIGMNLDSAEWISTL